MHNRPQLEIIRKFEFRAKAFDIKYDKIDSNNVIFMKVLKLQ